MSELRPLAVRFWEKVARADDDACWVWVAGVTRGGYGRFRVGGRETKTEYAHRVSYQLAHGPIPEGLFVCHHCDNPPCVNPKHLYAGTVKQNRDDAVARGQLRVVGAENYSAKLTEDDVREIRRLCDAGQMQKDVAEVFGVSQQNVSSIVTRTTWAQLDDGWCQEANDDG